jgi:hypothetical protein
LRGYSNLFEKFPDIHVDDIFIHHKPPWNKRPLLCTPRPF